MIRRFAEIISYAKLLSYCMNLLLYDTVCICTIIFHALPACRQAGVTLLWFKGGINQIYDSNDCPKLQRLQIIRNEFVYFST